MRQGDRGEEVRDFENAGTQDAHQAAAAAARGLEKIPGRCRAPYHEVAVRNVQTDGRTAAELEYTCGDGTDMRHGIWRFVISDGKSYNFFVTVPDSKFAGSKVIYDEMVRSFGLDA